MRDALCTVQIPETHDYGASRIANTRDVTPRDARGSFPRASRVMKFGASRIAFSVVVIVIIKNIKLEIVQIFLKNLLKMDYHV